MTFKLDEFYPALLEASLPPREALSNTFLMRYNNNAGTCFFIKEGDNKYLITAKHNVATIRTGDNVQLRKDNQWMALTIDEVIERADLPELDIVALKIGVMPRAEYFPISRSADGDYYLGQDVFIIGFPQRYLDLGLTDFAVANEGYPIPMVKKCVIANFGNKANVRHICLDVVANKGFSGGPVFHRKPSGEFGIAGVICKHLFDTTAVTRQVGGDTHELDAHARTYADISFAHGIKHIFEAPPRAA